MFRKKGRKKMDLRGEDTLRFLLMHLNLIVCRYAEQSEVIVAGDGASGICRVCKIQDPSQKFGVLRGYDRDAEIDICKNLRNFVNINIRKLKIPTNAEQC